MDPTIPATDLALEALTKLRELRAGPDKWAMETARRQYGYAVTCTVFSALVVESCLKRFIAMRIWFQTPEPVRTVLRAIRPKGRSIDRMLDFVQMGSTIDPQLVTDIRRLFGRRDRMFHVGATMTEKDGSRGLESPRLSKDDIEKAEWCFDVAQRVRAAVERMVNDPTWKFAEP